ncbi:hypothetical protein HALDL1_00780 (plasmid) [Halobacterium sp. DL1]|nr:hypothetical protein HALDL1_00780 [Halobacterium sp. DL1]
MIDLLFVVVVEFILDCEPVWLFESGNNVQDIPLESG